MIYNFILLVFSFALTACGSDSKVNANEDALGTSGLSVVYESTSETEAGKMVSHYHVHAVDDRGKPLSNLALNFSLINGVKEIRGIKLQTGTGTLLSSEPVLFRDANIKYTDTEIKTTDTLIILPTREKVDTLYLGDWKVRDVGTDLTLLENAYNLETIENLTYIVGNEERLFGGMNGKRGVSAIAHIEARKQEGNTTTEEKEKGFTYFDVVFDPILAGHTVTIGMHADSNGYRMGTSKVVVLRGATFSAKDEKVKNTGNTEFAAMKLRISPGSGGVEYLMDVDIVPDSFSVEPANKCKINTSKSYYHADANGNVFVAIDTLGNEKSNKTSNEESNTTKNEESNTTNNNIETTPEIEIVNECTVKWAGETSAIHAEY